MLTCTPMFRICSVTCAGWKLTMTQPMRLLLSMSLSTSMFSRLLTCLPNGGVFLSQVAR